jgi:hypothetical protein
LFVQSALLYLVPTLIFIVLCAQRSLGQNLLFPILCQIQVSFVPCIDILLSGRLRLTSCWTIQASVSVARNHAGGAESVSEQGECGDHSGGDFIRARPLQTPSLTQVKIQTPQYLGYRGRRKVARDPNGANDTQATRTTAFCENQVGPPFRRRNARLGEDGRTLEVSRLKKGIVVNFSIFFGSKLSSNLHA